MSYYFVPVILGKVLTPAQILNIILHYKAINSEPMDK